MAYPASIDSITTPAGTQVLSTPSHSGIHGSVNTAITAIETVMGTNSGTAVLKNFTAGDFAVRQNSGGTVQGTFVVNGGTFGTPVINYIASSGTNQPTKMNQTIIPTVVTLTDSPSGTISINSTLGNVFQLTLGTTAGNRTIGVPINSFPGAAITFAIKASGSANGTIVWGTTFRFSDAGTPSLGSASTWNYYGYRYHNDDGRWDFQGQSKNLI